MCLLKHMCDLLIQDIQCILYGNMYTMMSAMVKKRA